MEHESSANVVVRRLVAACSPRVGPNPRGDGAAPALRLGILAPLLALLGAASSPAHEAPSLVLEVVRLAAECGETYPALAALPEGERTIRPRSRKAASVALRPGASVHVPRGRSGFGEVQVEVLDVGNESFRIQFSVDRVPPRSGECSPTATVNVVADVAFDRPFVVRLPRDVVAVVSTDRARRQVHRLVPRSPRRDTSRYQIGRDG